jgi:predicted metal-dependent hydrolase
MIERFLAEKRTWLIQVLSGLPVWSSAPSYQIRGDYKKHKEQARTLVHRELERINIHYGFVYGRVSIRNTTSRWGSCSSKKNLNFSYRVFFLPPHLREYVLVHELCHLKEMNHGPAFWALVAQTVPNYRECRREVRKEVLA